MEIRTAKTCFISETLIVQEEKKMKDFDRERVNGILAQNGFGEIESVVIGGRDGAYSTVYALKAKPGEPEKVLKLYKREIANKQVVKDEFESMKKAFDVSDAFPIPYAFLKFDGCENPRFGGVKETLYGIVIEKLEALSFESTPKDKEILFLLKDLLEEVVKIHRVGGFRHGDIKPSNIMWSSRTGKYTLIDFNTVDTRCNTASTITSDSLRGSRYYIDPQSINIDDPYSCSYSPRSDIYALGMTARILMNNNRMEYVFDNEPDNRELLEAKKKLKPFKSIKYSKEFCALVSKATAFDRDDRFDNAQQMLDAVVALLRKMGAKVEDSVSASVEGTIIATAEPSKASVVRRRVLEDELSSHDFCNDEVFCEEVICEEEKADFDNIELIGEVSGLSVGRGTVKGDDEFRGRCEYGNSPRMNRAVKAIRDKQYDTALRILSKTKDKYTNFYKGCAYIGKEDKVMAEKEFKAGKDKMSYYMLYGLNCDESPDYAMECLEKASEMQCVPAMFLYGYIKYKSADPGIRSEGLSLITSVDDARTKRAILKILKKRIRKALKSD